MLSASRAPEILTVEVSGIAGPVATLQIDLEEVRARFPSCKENYDLPFQCMIKEELIKKTDEFAASPHGSIRLVQGTETEIKCPTDSSKPLQITAIKEDFTPPNYVFAYDGSAYVCLS